MWQKKIFRSREAMSAWVAKCGHLNQWNEIFVANFYGVEYRPLRRVG